MPLKPILACLLILGSPLYSQEFRKNNAVENYRQTINALNLMNALYLTPPQTQALLAVLNDLNGVRNEYQARLDALVPGMKKEYEKLYREIAGNQGISKEVQASAGNIHQQELALREAYLSKLGDLETRVDGLLTENQKCIVDEFKPCLIPPKNLRDPARVGQAVGDASAAVELLERLRKAPERRYPEAREKMLEAYLDRYEEKIKVLTPQEKKEERNRVAAVVNQARALPEVDFQMKKEDLGRSILIEPPAPGPKRKYELGKAGKILLDVRLIPVIEKRLASAS